MDPTIYQHLGVKVGFEADLAGGYGMPFNWLHVDDENFLAFNPNAYIALAVEGVVQLKLYWIEWTFKITTVIESFKPINYSGLWSLDDKESYCHSMGFNQDVFDISLNLEQSVMECDIGALSFIPMTPQPKWFECGWEGYTSTRPLWAISFLDEGDWHYDFLEWTCTTDEEEPEIEGIDTFIEDSEM